MSERVFRYVRHSQRAAYEALGWEASELPPPHGAYSCLMEWLGEGAPREPEDDECSRQ